MNHDLELLRDARKFFRRPNCDEAVIEVNRIFPDVRIPEKHPLYHGVYILYLAPLNDEEVLIHPSQRWTALLDLKITIPFGFVGIISHCTLDSDQSCLKVPLFMWTPDDWDEIVTVELVNDSNRVIKLRGGMKIAQMVLVRHCNSYIVDSTE